MADPEFFPEAVARTQEIVDHDHLSALRYLESVAAPLRRWGLTVSTLAAAVADAGSAIIEDARGDVIVMATHAVTGAKRAFVGSVTTRVVRTAEAPVLVIPPPPPADEPGLAGFGSHPHWQLV